MSKDNGNIGRTTILKRLEEINYRCEYSGDELTPDNLSADHRVAITEGGTHDMSNVALVTRQINAAKGTMSLDEFVSMCRKVARHFDILQASNGEPMLQ
jgi:5-methylcytosine-specific restriction endonuclease McrA